ncbi:MAG TPA: polysaccharide biosynthesis/export family protein [Gemmataceae bacterium]|nr:polysaccharide biosynthesis/export family protein [Gemmataceae bacterium]
MHSDCIAAPVGRSWKNSRRLAGLVAAAACLTAGCSSGPGGPFSAFNPTHQLLDSAKMMRQSAPVPAAVPRELDKRVQPPYTVEPGDVLLAQPADVESPVHLPGDQPVMGDGTIELGKYGRVEVAGKTVEQIEAAIKSVVDAQTKDAGVITVRVVTRASKVYYVLGEVNAPGAYQLSGRETVLDAVLAAGGLTDRAARDKIILNRPTAPDSCRIVLPVCWSEIVQLGDTSTNYQITAGDRIYVPSRTLCDDLQHQPSCPCGTRPQVPCPIPAAAPSCATVVEEGAVPPENWGPQPPAKP